jgi:hypothetical protein
MNTRRVPGITRNSGWLAVDAELVEARVPRQEQEATITKADPRGDLGVPGSGTACANRWPAGSPLDATNTCPLISATGHPELAARVVHVDPALAPQTIS